MRCERRCALCAGRHRRMRSAASSTAITEPRASRRFQLSPFRSVPHCGRAHSSLLAKPPARKIRKGLKTESDRRAAARGPDAAHISEKHFAVSSPFYCGLAACRQRTACSSRYALAKRRPSARPPSFSTLRSRNGSRPSHFIRPRPRKTLSNCKQDVNRTAPYPTRRMHPLFLPHTVPKAKHRSFTTSHQTSTRCASSISRHGRPDSDWPSSLGRAD